MLKKHASAQRCLADKIEKNRSLSVAAGLLRADNLLVSHKQLYPDFLEFLVANGDEILGRHLVECPGISQYT